MVEPGLEPSSPSLYLFTLTSQTLLHVQEMKRKQANYYLNKIVTDGKIQETKWKLIGAGASEFNAHGLSAWPSAQEKPTPKRPSDQINYKTF